MAPLFITGGTGYVGVRLVEALAPRSMRCLVRNVPAPTRAGMEFLRGNVTETASYASALRGCDTVVHLAAITGKAPRAEYFHVNTEGTRRLVEETKRAGVKRFLHLSTIAVKFQDISRYPYAQSKRAAENIVRESGLDYAIVRPTMIFGPGAPVFAGLARIAAAPVMPIFGDGRAPVQPVWIGDVVNALRQLLGGGAFGNRVVELGGADVISIEDLLSRIRKRCFGKPPRTIHVPAEPLAAVLGALEGPLLPLLPFTAGQLCSFTNSGVADGPRSPTGVDEMLAR